MAAQVSVRVSPAVVVDVLWPVPAVYVFCEVSTVPAGRRSVLGSRHVAGDAESESLPDAAAVVQAVLL